MIYFKLYQLLLSTISIEKPSNFQSLLELIQNSSEVKQLRESLGDEQSIETLLDILENLIDDGLINGRKIKVDGGRLFHINQVSTQGHVYLETLKKPDTLKKIKNFAKEEGLAPTPKNITMLLSRVLWD